jgi:membrane protease YdiL (CAAX protease family)
MPEWTTFAGLAGVVLALLLLLAALSQGRFRGGSADADPTPGSGSDPEATAGGVDPTDPDRLGGSAPDPAVDGGTPGAPEPTAEMAPFVHPFVDERRGSGGREADRSDPAGTAGPADPADLSTGALLLNVAVSQGLFASLLVAGALLTGIPATAFGLGPGAAALPALLAGVGLGVVLYAANEVGAAVGERVGFGGGEELRAVLAPDSAAGWAALLLVVLPVIAGFEELLFRGVLVGVLSAGFGVSPWLLAGGSSVAFALGHGAQGRAGIAVSGSLGFALAAGFVLTGSLVAVVVAHYLVNALEFVVHEGLDVGGSRG